MWQPLCITEKGGRNWGQPQAGRPLGRPTQWWRPSIYPGAQGAHGTPFARVPPVPLRVLPSSALFALVSLQVHKKKKKKISLFCILICISFAFCVYLLLFARTCLWWYHYPARTVLWCVIAHKNDFVECYHPQEWFFVRSNHAPQGLLTLGQLPWFSQTLT